MAMIQRSYVDEKLMHEMSGVLFICGCPEQERTPRFQMRPYSEYISFYDM